MATLIKANFTPTTNTAGLKGNLRYYQTRPDPTGARQQRPGFDAERDDLERAEAYKMVEDSTQTYAYRIVLSPGDDLEPDEMRAWTREVLADLEAQRGQHLIWVAYVHDHPEHPHVHAIVMTDDKLDREDLHAMRQAGDRALHELAAVRQELAHHPYQQELEESRRVRWSH